MGNPQGIKFSGVTDFLAHLPAAELEIVEALRNIILDCLPDARERLTYNVPFYYRRRRVCYIWPASVPWGNISTGVAVGFLRGSEMGTLPATSGAQRLRKLIFHHPADIDETLLRTYLYEAAALDDGPADFYA